MKSNCYSFGLVLNLVKVHVLGLFMETVSYEALRLAEKYKQH